MAGDVILTATGLFSKAVAHVFHVQGPVDYYGEQNDFDIDRLSRAAETVIIFSGAFRMSDDTLEKVVEVVRGLDREVDEFFAGGSASNGNAFIAGKKGVSTYAEYKGNGVSTARKAELRKQLLSRWRGAISRIRDVPQAFRLIDDAIYGLTERGEQVVVGIFDMDLFAPPTGAAGITPPVQNVLSIVRQWMVWETSFVEYRRKPPLVIMFSSGPINEALSSAYQLKVSLPNYEERLLFINAFNKRENDKRKKQNIPVGKFTAEYEPEYIARMTNGLLRKDILDFIMMVNGLDTPPDIKTFKDERLKIATGGTATIDDPRFGLDDVVGQEHIAPRLRIFADMLKTADPHTPKGIVLIGPPGTGKSMLAEAIAKEAGVTFLRVQQAGLLSKYLGESEQKFERLLAFVEAVSPAVVFIDELDKFFAGAGTDSTGVRTTQLGRLQDWIADESMRGKVLIIAASNQPDDIPDALLRPGRLEVHIPILPLQTDDEVAAMLEVSLRVNDIPYETDGIDFHEIATGAAPVTGAHIAGWVLEAYYGSLPGVVTADVLKNVIASSPYRADLAAGWSDNMLVGIPAHYIHPAYSDRSQSSDAPVVVEGPGRM